MEEKSPWYYLVLLILAGEAVFILPFVLPRIFRPTVLEVFGLDNTQLGLCFSVYGITALCSYLFGGPIADKYAPRKLIAIALWTTAFGGFIFANTPSFATLRFLYGYWGFTTIFLFWAPMIKATRVWGGALSQGKAFGLLDGGRGLTGALFGLLGVFIFSLLIPEQDLDPASTEQQRAFRYVIYTATVIIILIGVLVWFFMKSGKDEEQIQLDRIALPQISNVLKLPSVWLLMAIILCAYVGYKITDILSQYAREIMQYKEIESAQVGTFIQILRPTTGIIVGLLVDRYKITLWLTWSFITTAIGGAIFASGLIEPSSTILYFLSVLIIVTGVYAARALYFGVMSKGQIPLTLTGTAVGIVSLVGYTPDIFAGPAYGYLLDTYPGEQGYRYVFWMLVGFAVFGGMAAFAYNRMYGSKITQKSAVSDVL